MQGWETCTTIDGASGHESSDSNHYFAVPGAGPTGVVWFPRSFYIMEHQSPSPTSRCGRRIVSLVYSIPDKA
jgi:hypothetical protein